MTNAVRNVWYGVTTPAYWRDNVKCYYCERKRPWWWPTFKVETPPYDGYSMEPPEPSFVCRWRCAGDPHSWLDRKRRWLFTLSRGRIDL